MHWLQSLDVGLLRFINQTLSNPVFDAVMPFVSGRGAMPFFFTIVFAAGLILVWKGGTRARLTPDGLLRTCLLREHEVDLLTPLRKGASIDELRAMLVEGLWDFPLLTLIRNQCAILHGCEHLHG